jgi:electron transfer flavoprotein alpha subunit
MQGPIVIIVEHARGEIRPAAYELMALARKIREANGSEIRAVILGDDIQGAAEQFSAVCAVPVTAVSAARLRDYNAELYTMVLVDMLTGMKPSYVGVPHSSQGADFAPGLALRLSAACVSGVEGMHAGKDGLRFYRPIYGGKIRAEIKPVATTTVLTLQPGSFKPYAAEQEAEAFVQPFHITVPDPSFGSLAVKTVPSEGIDLTQAKVLVAAGRGICEEEHLDLVQQLAKQFPQSATCGSRPIIDAGWMPYNRQVGITGATVAPSLYIACGISGAAQHVSGMRGAGFVVSINSDPGAAIFNVSDICIVEELTAFIPLFIEISGKK